MRFFCTHHEAGGPSARCPPGKPGSTGMNHRRVLLSGGALIVAAAIGFITGHAGHLAKGPAGGPVAASDNAPLPPIAVSADALANMQLHYGDAAIRPLLRNVPATGIVTYDELRLARIVPPARGRVEASTPWSANMCKPGNASPCWTISTSAPRAAASPAPRRPWRRRSLSSPPPTPHCCGRRSGAHRWHGAERFGHPPRRRRRRPGGTAHPAGHAAAMAGHRAAADAAFLERLRRERHPDPRDSQGAVIAPFDGVVDLVALAAGQLVDPAQQFLPSPTCPPSGCRCRCRKTRSARCR